ncbi:hypothetical protein HDC30_002409 [Pseudomonas sp. JAI115]|uniref:type III secretion system domain-containing protein n=1 Tax=Pseudomonas sp. JAI115 TaxID=2723061 RepID=UPI00160FC972|nr:type III secretion system domain-containing protein [Pseudomonas sp. JAI115]MBB6155186.1 hypothetical protein [Pseudomonas sp. JAI115]
MSPELITPAVQHLHRLAYSPGSWMNDAWWAYLELDTWQHCYQRYAACRPAINRLIHQRRGPDWRPLPATLTLEQQSVLELEPRFVRLVTALGLVALNCPEHLLLKAHRQALMPVLDAPDCTQLLALHPDWNRTALALPVEGLALGALQAGAGWWRRDAAPCAVTHLLDLHLPPPGPGTPTPTPTDHAVHWFLKIGRFL